MYRPYSGVLLHRRVESATPMVVVKILSVQPLDPKEGVLGGALLEVPPWWATRIVQGGEHYCHLEVIFLKTERGHALSRSQMQVPVEQKAEEKNALPA